MPDTFISNLSLSSLPETAVAHKKAMANAMQRWAGSRPLVDFVLPPGPTADPISDSALKFVEKPGASEGPVGADRPLRNPEDARSLFRGQTGEEAQAHDLLSTGVLGGEFLQSFVELQDSFRILFSGRKVQILEWNSLTDTAPASLLPLRPTGMFDQDAAHGLRRCAEELGTTLPSLRVPPRSLEAEERLMHEGRGLQRVVLSLPRDPCAGQPVQLVVDRLIQTGPGHAHDHEHNMASEMTPGSSASAQPTAGTHSRRALDEAAKENVRGSPGIAISGAEGGTQDFRFA